MACNLIFLLWQDLVPCVLLSFDDEQVLIWRGKDWKSMYPQAPVFAPTEATITRDLENKGTCWRKKNKIGCIIFVSKVMSEWNSSTVYIHISVYIVKYS